jgi:uncharacterized protein
MRKDDMGRNPCTLPHGRPIRALQSDQSRTSESVSAPRVLPRRASVDSKRASPSRGTGFFFTFLLAYRLLYFSHMKRAIIVPCWEGTPDYCWYPWVKKELEAKGFEVTVPAFPDTDNPKLDAWLPMLKEVIGEPDEDLYLIGHSVGCITIMRYLELLPSDTKIGGVIMVAGFTEPLGFDELKNFFSTDVDFEKIKASAKKFVDIYSDNDPFVPVQFAKQLQQKLGAEIIFKPGMKHFSGTVDGEDSCLELPDVVESVLEMQK